MPTSPVKMRIPLTSLGHLVTEVKQQDVKLIQLRTKVKESMPKFEKEKLWNESEKRKQLFGIKAPSPAELTGWRKYFNSYTIPGRRNCVLATYGMVAVTGAAYLMHRRNKTANQSSTSTD